MRRQRVHTNQKNKSMTKQERKAEKRLLYYLKRQKNDYVQTFCEYERNIFAECKTERTQKRVRNTWSSEQAGTCGSYTHTIRFENSYITKVCKSRNLY